MSHSKFPCTAYKKIISTLFLVSLKIIIILFPPATGKWRFVVATVAIIVLRY